MRAVLLGFSWFFLSAGVIVASAAMVNFLINPPPQPEGEYQQTVKISAPQVLGTEQVANEAIAKAESGDARVILVHNFLERYNSPLLNEANIAQKLVAIADRHRIDFRLLPAIAMQESNLCKVIPEDSYICLGLGVHERGTWHFDSYEANFEAAAKILKQNYLKHGLTNPEEIMRKYTPSSDGSWAASVNQWMAEMRYDDREAGRELKTNANLLEFVIEDTQATQSSQASQ